MDKQIILTGLRANSEFHIGNYLGAILPVVEMQKRHAGKYQINMFVPDLHSFTTPIDHSKLYRQIISNLRVFVAAGLNIHDKDTYIYRQSYIPAHSELTWILDCFIGFGELTRMTQFKDKARQLLSNEAEEEVESRGLKRLFAPKLSDIQQDSQMEHVSVGLFNYPALMAADILLYGAKYVPVGEDQRQHLELARDVAIRMNNKFGRELFAIPDDWDGQLAFSNRDSGVRIRSLRNPEKKMSKSVEDPSGTIMLSDDPSEAGKKVLRAETDNVGKINYDFDKQPGVSNLLQMLALLTERPQIEVNKEWVGRSGYSELKKAVAASLSDFLYDFQMKLEKVDEQALLEKLEKSERAMRETAANTLLGVQIAVGLRP